MRCESCTAEWPAGQRFCGQCGSLLALTCAACGSPAASPDQLFCGRCGTEFASSEMLTGEMLARAGAPEPTPIAELRWASVLFVDLVGYSSLTEGWDAEDVRALLTGYFEVARRVVERYGGVVEKFIGDAVVAVWGSQSARADDAERSVRAGLDIVEAVAGYGWEHDLAELRARAGVVTGQVSSWGSELGLVAGDRVSLAARVQSVAEPGWVLVDEVTMRATRATMAYAEAGRHGLKGFADPVPLWRATRVISSLGGAQRVEGLEAAFVGRNRELTLVKELFHATVESGRTRLVAVSGVAGIGKSRLGWEFEKYVDGLAGAVFWHRGRSPSYGDGVAFWALAEMLRSRLGISDEDSAEVAAAKVSEGLNRWVPDAEERAFVSPRLGVLVGAVDREFSTEDLFAGWRLFLERLATIQPVVLLFEDLHWADGGLLDFVEYLLDWAAGLPIYIVSFARPELTDRRPGWLADRRNATLLHLDPLPGPVIEELLGDLVPDMPEPVAARIAAQAGGIPLYAVETIRALVDRGLVVNQGGVLCVVGDVEDLDVPASLTSVIAARLDGLPSAEKDLVRGLSVLGDAFPRNAVAAVSDSPSEQHVPLLQALVRKEILSVRSDSMAPERSEYAFMQAMLRSVAYDSLTRRERKMRHLAVANHLQSSLPDDGADVVEIIAAHLRDAYTAAGTDPAAVQLRAEAARAFERAGARAGTLGSPENAEKHFRTAAELSVEESDRARNMEDAASMADRAGRPDDALTALQTAADAHRKAGRHVDAARLAALTGWIAINLDQPEKALGLLQDGLAVLEREGDAEAVHLLIPLASALAATGQRAAAADHLERALALANALEDADALHAALNTKAQLLVTEHRATEANALFLAAAEVALANGDTEGEAMARVNHGYLRMQADRADATEPTEVGLRLYQRLGHRLGQAEGARDLSLSHFYAGRWDEAERLARQAVDASPAQLGFGRLALLIVLAARGDLAGAEEQLSALEEIRSSDVADVGVGTARGVIEMGRGHPDAALDAAGKAVRLCVLNEGLLSQHARLAWPLAMEAAVAADRLDEAESLLGFVADLPSGHAPPYLKAQLRRCRALFAAARGERDNVESDLRGAVNAFRGLGYPYWMARSQVDLGGWLAAQGRRVDAQPLLADATKTFTQLGAQPDLDCLESDQQVSSDRL